MQAMDLKTAAQFTGISEHTLRRYAKTGKIAHFKIGRRLVLDKGDLERFLQSCRIPEREEVKVESTGK